MKVETTTNEKEEVICVKITIGDNTFRLQELPQEIGTLKVTKISNDHTINIQPDCSNVIRLK